VTRFVVLLRRPNDIERGAFRAHVIDALGRPLARLDATRWVAAYVPGLPEESGGSPLPSKRGLPKATSFDALIEVAGSGDVDVTLAAPPYADHPRYRVEERRLKEYPRDWADGVESPGVFLVSAVCRAETLDLAHFDAHWRDNHGPLALAHHVGMWDYRQGVVVERLTEGAPAFDGIARLGFPTHADFETGLFRSKESGRIIAEDTARFIDVSRLEVAMLQEIVLKS
jgi:uncharacterized protein (TIGR02118 family)